MDKTESRKTSGSWTALSRWAFLCASVFLLLLIVPLDWHFWHGFAGLAPWQACFHFATYLPRFIPAPRWGFASFVNLWLCLAVGTLAGTLLFLLRASHIHYSRAYLWMRALLRYRLALALLAYGLLKVFSLQFPLPTVSELNTQYGDLMQWKIYYLTVGVGKMGYQPLIGWLEISAALLLLWNRTATIGACLSAAMLTNIVPANFAYQFGDHLFASTLMLFSVIIAAHDGWRLLQLLVLQTPAKADRMVERSATNPRLTLYARTAIAIFGVAFTATILTNLHHSRWPYPDTPGIAGLTGVYNVREFTINGEPLPYTLTGNLRWQDIVFEDWNTFSIRVNRPMTIQVAKPAVDDPQAQQLYEVAGNGGRHFYSYQYDTTTHTITATGKNDPNERLSLHYDKRPKGAILLEGTDVTGAKLHIVLDQINKQYLLNVGRRKPVNLY